MKKIFMLSTVFLFAMMQLSCTGMPQKETKTPIQKVTFIELGSVRCIPCRKMEAVLDNIRENYSNDVKVVFYDVWTEAGKPYAKQYKIQAIPTQVFLDKDGKEYFRHVGYFPKEEVIKILKQKDVKQDKPERKSE